MRFFIIASPGQHRPRSRSSCHRYLLTREQAALLSPLAVLPAVNAPMAVLDFKPSARHGFLLRAGLFWTREHLPAPQKVMQRTVTFGWKRPHSAIASLAGLNAAGETVTPAIVASRRLCVPWQSTTARRLASVVPSSSAAVIILLCAGA